jgi:hypothetical protein
MRWRLHDSSYALAMRRNGLFLVLLVLACRGPGSERTSSPEAGTPAPASPAATEPALPQAGQLAPELALRTIDGTTVTLAEARASGPVVLVFGSFT